MIGCTVYDVLVSIKLEMWRILRMGITPSNALLSQQQNNRLAETTSLILAYVQRGVTTRALSSLAYESGGTAWTHCVCVFVCVCESADRRPVCRPSSWVKWECVCGSTARSNLWSLLFQQWQEETLDYDVQLDQNSKRQNSWFTLKKALRGLQQGCETSNTDSVSSEGQLTKSPKPRKMTTYLLFVST